MFIKVHQSTEKTIGALEKFGKLMFFATKIGLSGQISEYWGSFLELDIRIVNIVHTFIFSI